MQMPRQRDGTLFAETLGTPVAYGNGWTIVGMGKIRAKYWPDQLSAPSRKVGTHFSRAKSKSRRKWRDRRKTEAFQRVSAVARVTLQNAF